MKRRSILILSHQGFSFIEDVVRGARDLGLRVHVLSSQPVTAGAERLKQITALADTVLMVGERHLGRKQVFDHLNTLLDEGERVLGVVSVWEGYRVIMAEANETLGAADLLPQQVVDTLDKFKMRRHLRAKGLSTVRTRIANPRVVAAAVRGGRLSFVKPRRGLGSFGAFRLTTRNARKLPALAAQMQADREYAGLFGSRPQFVMEDYIPGVEFSFEVIAHRGRIFFLATHEKVEVQESEATTLENACVTPPVTVGAQSSGQWFVAQVLLALGLTQGCFHVEARFNQESGVWEIIEINPRVGGALIKESVKASRGACLLTLWMQTLIARSPSEHRAMLAELRDASSAPVRQGTLFRVFFGEPGRRISAIGRGRGPRPEILKIHAHSGDKLPSSDREVFLGQALWVTDPAEHWPSVSKLLKKSANALEVTYER